ncbi:MAG TPA: hypothetical protein DEG17_04145, partial [Cyanobacteria bacterium UBA11149]|nr:hypothetical protein [Cyanobacteria bacterium UBA11153]HBW88082.1 hypothetical protein [Cyanobacteria bacterium UBA11149]
FFPNLKISGLNAQQLISDRFGGSTELKRRWARGERGWVIKWGNFNQEMSNGRDNWHWIKY